MTEKDLTDDFDILVQRSLMYPNWVKFTIGGFDMYDESLDIYLYKEKLIQAIEKASLKDFKVVTKGRDVVVHCPSKEDLLVAYDTIFGK